MDDLAGAAGISRQGLYLHFPNKEVIFEASLKLLVSRIITAANAIFAQRKLSMEGQLLAAFDTFHGGTLDVGLVNHRSEVIAMARVHAPNIVTEFENEFRRLVERILTARDIAASWSDAKVSARQLSEHLFFVSTGAAQTSTRSEYLRHMRVAATIVLCQMPDGLSSPRTKEIRSK
jgi:AcrR family transcriptional regulator